MKNDRLFTLHSFTFSLAGGSSYKKFHSLLKKFAETERVDGWKFYDLMLEHFPHYAKENQVESQQQQQDEFRLDPMSPQVDAFKNFFNDDTQDSVMMSLQQQNWLNEDISSLHQDDPDRIFINELMKDMKELDEEAKSMFKIKAQTLMHGLKYNRMLL